MDRRSFLGKILLRIFYVFGSVVIAFPALSFITFRKDRNRTVVFRPDERLSSVNFKEGVYLIRKEERELYALSARCTHLGCSLNFDPISQRFRCPCHGSVFDISGIRLAGPAKRDLLRIPVSAKPDTDVVLTLTL
jgi:cytochrome b6-f complex iron-sulfur subunit